MKEVCMLIDMQIKNIFTKMWKCTCILLSVSLLSFMLSIYFYKHTSDRCILSEIISSHCTESTRPNGVIYYIYSIECVVNIDGTKYNATSTCTYDNDNKLCKYCKSEYRINSEYLCVKLHLSDYILEIDDSDKYYITFILLMIIGFIFFVLFVASLTIDKYDYNKRCHFDIFTNTNIKNEDDTLL